MAYENENFEIKGLDDVNDILSSGRSRQIKTRETSFKNIKDNWQQIKQQIDAIYEQAMMADYDFTPNGEFTLSSISKIDDYATMIASLEADIDMVPSEERSKYINKRSLKITSELGKTIREMYLESSVANENDVVPMNDLESINVVPTSFEADGIRDSVENGFNEVNGMAINEDELDGGALSREEIENVVNSEFADINLGNPAPSMGTIEDVFGNVDSNHSELSREDTKDVINEIFAGINFDNPEPSMGTIEDVFEDVDSNHSELSREDAKDVINSEFADINLGNLEPSMQEIEDAFGGALGNSELSREDIKDVINESFNNERMTQETESFKGKEISPEEVANLINESFGFVSKSGNAAKLDKYDENGEFVGVKDEEIDMTPQENETRTSRERYNYKPMTDEEIAIAQDEIEYDKYEQIYKNEYEELKREKEEEQNKLSLSVPSISFKEIFKPTELANTAITGDNYTEEEMVDNIENQDQVRDEVIIAPDRAEAGTYGIENITFDYSTATANDLAQAVQMVTNFDDLKKMLERTEALKADVEAKRKNAEAKEMEAAKDAERAAEVKVQKIASDRITQSKIEELDAYMKSLEEDCEFFDRKAEVAQYDSQCNQRFIQSQMDAIESNGALNAQIDSVLESEGSNEISRRK